MTQENTADNGGAGTCTQTVQLQRPSPEPLCSPCTPQMPAHHLHPPLTSIRAPLLTTRYKKTHFARTLEETHSCDSHSKILLGKSAFLKCT